MKSQVRLTENHQSRLGGWRGIVLLAALVCLVAGRAAAGTISLSVNTNSTSSATFNLSAEGDLDWAKWGINSATDWEHKNTGLPAQIPNYTQLNSPSVARGTGTGYGFNWMNGTPDAALTANTDVYTQNTNAGAGFQFSVPVTATSEVLNLYGGQYKSRGALVLALSDGSALVTFTNTDLNPPYNNKYVGYRYTVTFSGTPGTTLNVAYIITNTPSGNGNGSIQLYAATLSSSNYLALSAATPVLSCPAAVVANTTFTLTDLVTGSTNAFNGMPSFGYQWQVSTNNGPYYNIANASSNPFTLKDTVPGSFNYRLAVTNGALGAVTSAPVNLNVVTSFAGSLQESSTALPSGSAINLTSIGLTDWAQWGGFGPTSFDNKAGIIGNYTQLGTGGTADFTSSVNFNWTDATTADTTGANITDCVGIPLTTGVSDGFQVLLPASTNVQVALVYVGTLDAQVHVEASLSDSSSPVISDNPVVNTGTIYYQFRYSAASAGQTLKIKVTGVSSTAADSMYSLEAVALQPYSPGNIQLLSKENINATYNLSLEGDLDWAKWGGVYGGYPASTFEEKEIGGTAVGMITWNLIGTYSGVGAFDNAPRCTWTNGTPDLAASATSGLYTKTYGNGFEVDVAAAQTNRILHILVGAGTMPVRITAALSDASATTLIDDTTAAGSSYRVNLQFAAGSPGQHLIFQVFNNVPGDLSGSVSLMAASLSYPGAIEPLTVTTPVLAPTNVVVAGSMVTLTTIATGLTPLTYQWLVSSDGTNYSPVAASPNGPELIDVAPTNNAGAMTNTYEVVVTGANNQGSVTSAPVSLTVSGPAASELIAAGSPVLGTSLGLDGEGVLDWATWGSSSSANMIERKAGGTNVISDYFRVLGNYAFYGIYNSPFSYYFTNGVPDQALTNSYQNYVGWAPGYGYELDVPASDTEQVFNVYCAMAGGHMHFEAKMSDGGAPIFVDESFITTNYVPKRYSVKYASPTPGAYLIVRFWTMSGNVVLASATLAPPLGIGIPSLAPTNVVTAGSNTVTLTAGAVVNAGTLPLTYQWLVSANNGAYAPLANSNTNVLSLTNVPAGSFNYTLAVTYPVGSVTSAPVALTVTSSQPIPPGTILGPTAGPGAGQYTLSWTNASALLLQAPDLTGPWTTNSAVSPFTFTPTNSRMFFRLQGQ
jgi:hypothetical protein